ncbi:MAG: hypothetical protein F4106_03400 [Gemmatimonadetes bacterium]|nr:hypothetical protein [Gemmatimonadota bacterium]MYC92986.1 hypothetical protein [Gemmatimonadota bacterium]MYJ17084.1 hypothetical protein [Gemmatimonadota bacterium]
MGVGRTSNTGIQLGPMLALLVASQVPALLPLSAQSIGDRIRVTTPGATTVGEVTIVDDHGFRIREGEIHRSFTYREIARLERSTGRKSRWKTGLLYGGGAGVGAGLLYGALVSGACDALTLGGASQECAETGAEVAVVAGLVWGAAGGLLGTGVGALVRRELWTDIPFARADVSLRPIIGRVPGTNSMLLGVRIAH